MQGSSISVSEVEESAGVAERTADELEQSWRAANSGEDDPRWELSIALRRTARSLRLALVAEADASIMNRIQLRLETMLRRAVELELDCDPPVSQRATLPPPLGMAPEDVWERENPSERPTLRPAARGTGLEPRAKASSGVVAKVDQRAEGPGEVRPRSQLRPPREELRTRPADRAPISAGSGGRR